jgi:protein O-GlcNAc transferase
MEITDVQPPPHSAGSWRRRGDAELAAGDCTAAVDSYRRAIAIEPDNPRAHNNLGQALMRLERRAEAIASYRRATQLAADYAVAYNNLGIALNADGETEAALAAFTLALEHAPDLAEAHHNYGNALRRLNRLADALRSYDRAFELRPACAEILVARGDVLAALTRFDEALTAYERALQLRPQEPRVLNKAAALLLMLQRPIEALTYLERALALQADSPEAWAGGAAALRQLHRYEEARSACERALELKADCVPALGTLAEVLMVMGQQQLVDDCLRRILELQPARGDIRLMAVMNQIPQVPRDATQVADSRRLFTESLTQFECWLASHPQVPGPQFVGAATPLYLAYQPQCNLQLLARHGRLCCELMARWERSAGTTGTAAARATPKLRVGIISAHVRDHSVYRTLVRGWIGQLERRTLEVGIIHLGSLADEETARARACTDFFIDGTRPLEQWVRDIRALGLDALVYPEIGMHALTLQLASLRLAPIQIAAWGHPETTGLPSMDYYLSAQCFEPPEGPQYYSERLVALTNLGCYYEPYELAPAPIDIGRWGTRGAGPLFVCPGMPFKYAPQDDHVFADVAQRLGRCQFVFFNGVVPRLAEGLQQRIAATFRARGLEPADHLLLMPWQPTAGFFGLLRQADVLLDTIGFSGFNTMMQAIECELPAVSIAGRFMRGRLGSGILQQAGLPELVTRTKEEYVARAIELATDQGLVRDVRRRLRAGSSRVFRDGAAIASLAEFLDSLRSPR